MKILLTMNLPYFPTLGGANKGNRYMIEALAGKHHSVEAVVPALGTPSNLTHTEFLSRLADEGIDVASNAGIDVFALNGVKVHAVEGPSRLRPYLVERMREFEPDWVLVASEEPTQKLLEAALKSCPGRVVYIAQTPSFFPFGPQAFYPSQKRTKLLEQVTAVVASSKFLAGYIRQWSNLDPVVVYMPVYGSSPFPYFGQFEKGFVTMVNPCLLKGITIFLALARALPNIEFAAVPTWGTTSADCVALESLPNVRLLEPCADFDKILAQTRLLLMPSLWLENFPLTAIESMLRGIPVIGSNVGGIPEVKLGTDYVIPVRPIERFKESLDDNEILEPIIPEQDISAWRDTLESLLSDRALYERQSRSARNTSSDFVSSLSIDPLENLLLRLATDLSVVRKPAPVKPESEIRQSEASSTDTTVESLNDLTTEQQALLMLWLRDEAASAAARNIQETPIQPVSRGEELLMSFAQQRLWFIYQLDPHNPAYNLPAAIRLSGKLNEEALEKSLSAIVQRHESLRTSFADIQGRCVQVIKPHQSMDLPLVDLSDMDKDERDAEALRLAQGEGQRAFDLIAGPVLRATLLRLADEEHVILLTMHHIVSDAWSMGLLISEVGELYEGITEGRQPRLKEPSIQYADYAAWQREWLQGDALERQVSYWKRQLAGPLAVLQLPTHNAIPRVRTNEGAHQNLGLSKTLTETLKQLSKREGVTLFMTLLAAFKALLYSYSEQEDIVVGTDVANRNRVETEGLIGCFVNQLVLRTDLSGNPTFEELLYRVRDCALEGYAHQDVPFERVVQELNPDRDMSRPPLFQVKLVLQNTPRGAAEVKGLEMSALRVDTKASQVDVNLNLVDTEQGLKGSIEYSTDIFDARRITQFLESYERVLEFVATDGQARLNEIRQVVVEAERINSEKYEKAFAEASIKRLKTVRRNSISASQVEIT